MAFQRLEAAALARLLPSVRGQTVLDLGCGKARASRLALERGAARAAAADFFDTAICALVEPESR